MVKSALPGPNILIADEHGTITDTWWRYFLNEHNRTGGNSFDKVDLTSTAVIQAQTDILDATAQGLFQVTQGTPSSGAIATILFQVRTSLADPLHTASFRMSALSAGASKIEMAATEVDIDGTLLSNGAIISDHIAPNSATIPVQVAVAGPITPTLGQVNTWVNLATLDSFTSVGKPIAISGQFMLHNTDTGSPGTHHYGVRLQRNGSTVWPFVAPTYGSDGGSYFNQPIDWIETPGAGAIVYTLDYFPDSISCDAVNIVLKAREAVR